MDAASPAPLPQQGGRNSSLRQLPWAKSKEQENVWVFSAGALLFLSEEKDFGLALLQPVVAQLRAGVHLSGFSVKVLLKLTLSDLRTFSFGISFCLFRATIKTKEVPA